MQVPSGSLPADGESKHQQEQLSKPQGVSNRHWLREVSDRCCDGEVSVEVAAEEISRWAYKSRRDQLQLVEQKALDRRPGISGTGGSTCCPAVGTARGHIMEIDFAAAKTSVQEWYGCDWEQVITMQRPTAGLHESTMYALRGVRDWQRDDVAQQWHICC